MSKSVINPYQQFLDEAGVPVSSGTVTFFINTTATIDSIFSDEDLTIAQANPYTLDAAGRIRGDIKYNGKKTLQLKDKNGGTIRTLDDVAAPNSNQASDINYTPTATVQQRLNNLDVPDYATLRAIAPSQVEDGDTVTVTDAGIAGSGNIRKVTTHGLTDNGGTIIVLDTNTYWARFFDVVDARWFLAYDGTDDSTQMLALLQGGFDSISFPDGAPTLNSTVEATLTASLKMHGPGVITWGGISTVNWMIKINIAGFDLDFGVSTDGNNLIGAGLLALNTTAQSGDLPYLKFGGSPGAISTHKDFKMNATGLFNEACFIQGSFEFVELCHNHVMNISRAAGTGTPGSTGTTGMTVAHSASTFFAKKILIHDNITEGVFSDDPPGSNDVDQDGLRILMPDPTNFLNTNATVNLYVDSQVESHSNTYINCRGRAEKFQCMPHTHDNTVIRNGDRTLNGSSTEINCQWGVGTVHDIDFRYQDFDSGGITSPISTAVVLVSFFQGTYYGERKVGASTKNLRIFNEIGSAVKDTIDAIVTFQTSTGPDVINVPVMTVRGVEMSGGDVLNIVRTSFMTGAEGLLVMDDITVPKCLFGAIGTGSANNDIVVKATGILNLDGITGTPGNFVTDFAGANKSWSGAMIGFGNLGWTNNYNRGADFTLSPRLEGGSLTDGNGQNGGALSVQSTTLDDDATYVFDRRGFGAGDHLFTVSCNFGSENSSAMFYSAGASGVITEKTGAGSTNFSLGTGSNPDVDTNINLWIDSSGRLNLKNRLGSSRSFTIVYMG